jgi:hypothetical protein
VLHHCQREQTKDVVQVFTELRETKQEAKPEAKKAETERGGYSGENYGNI